MDRLFRSFYRTISHHSRVWLQLLLVSLKRFEQQQRRRDAAAMTYTTLFALVPVITVSYSVLSAIPALQNWGEDVNQQLLGYVLPQGNEVISDYLTRFSQQARKLTWIGVAVLFITVLLLLRTIEEQFNRIWNVKQSRSGVAVFLRYWAILSLGPLFFGAAFATSSLIAAAPLWADATQHIPDIARLLPWFFSAAALMALYLLVPNCKVPWQHGLFAALFVATVFETAKYVFGQIIGLFPSYQLIYGTFAAVPLFLIWVYFSWNLVIYGAELSFNFGHLNRREAQGQTLLLRLKVIEALVNAQHRAEPLSQAQLEQQIRAFNARDIDLFLQLARHKHWLLVSEEGGLCWLPDPQQQAMAELLADLPLQQLTSAAAQGNELDKPIHNWQQALMERMESQVNRPIAGFITMNTDRMPPKS